MKRFAFFAIAAAFLGTAALAYGQEPAPKPGPPDKPVHVEGNAAREKINKAVAPYIAKAKKTYPDAKARYLKGLPKNHRFYVTYSLNEKGEGGSSRFEQVFMAVRRIKDGKITAAISSDLNTVKTYKMGQVITFPEKDIMDWTITRPDGTEEGNFVGNFMDTYKP